MDQFLRFTYDRQSSAVRRRETEARRGVPALEVLAERLAGSAGNDLSEEERQTGGTVLQWAMGIGSGVLYAALRNHIPGQGIRRGLAYGAAFSLVVDEGLTPLLGLAPGPVSFPWQTHTRGFVGHLVFGVAAEVVLSALEERPSQSEDGVPLHLGQ